MIKTGRRRINFLPKELRASFINFRSLTQALAVSFVVIPVLAAAVNSVHWRYQAAFEEDQARSEANQKELQFLMKLREQRNETQLHMTVEKTREEKVLWSEAFQELSTITPKQIWLTNFDTKIGEGGKSFVLTGNTTSKAELAAFLARLEKSYFFRGVKVKFTETLGDYESLIRFQFEGPVYSPNEKKNAST